jgi:hypothetical protein
MRFCEVMIVFISVYYIALLALFYSLRLQRIVMKLRNHSDDKNDPQRNSVASRVLSEAKYHLARLILQWGTTLDGIPRCCSLHDLLELPN